MVDGQGRADADQRGAAERRAAASGALLGHVAGAIETRFHKGSWRNPSANDARWLRFLAACGYTLAEVEQQIVDAVDARTSENDTEPDPITNEDPADD